MSERGRWRFGVAAAVGVVAALMVGCAWRREAAMDRIVMAFDIANTRLAITQEIRQAFRIPVKATERDEIAAFLFDEAARLDAKGSGAYYNMAFFYLDGRDCERAKECLRKHLVLEPGHADTAALLEVIEKEDCWGGRLFLAGMDAKARVKFRSDHPDVGFHSARRPPQSALSAASWKVNGKPVPDREWAKSDGDFGAQLVFTDKPDELFAAWEEPGAAVLLSETVVAKRGVPIVGVVFFAGCAANERGKCEATVRFTAETPEGKPWGDPVDAELWIDKPAPEKGLMQLSAGNMGIVIDPDDPLGTYKVKAVVTDKVAHKRMVLERTFTAVEAAPPGAGGG